MIKILKVDIELDLRFWALLPAININAHCREIEFEWLCLGIYIEAFSPKSHSPLQVNQYDDLTNSESGGLCGEEVMRP